MDWPKGIKKGGAVNRRRPCFVLYISEYRWLGRRDSNPTYLIQSQVNYTSESTLSVDTQGVEAVQRAPIYMGINAFRRQNRRHVAAAGG
jgi:hypothetical protein